MYYTVGMHKINERNTCVGRGVRGFAPVVAPIRPHTIRHNIIRRKLLSPATSSAVPNLFKGIKGNNFSVSRSFVISDSINPTKNGTTNL